MPEQPHPAITAADARNYDPRTSAPPVVTDDGHLHAVGEAHGRIAPLVGNYRPYIYDVALPDGRRVYADTVDDVLAVMLGGHYGDVTDALVQRDATMPPAPADLDEEAEPTPEQLAAFDQYLAARQERTRLLVELAAIRYRHADEMRIRLQQQINTAAHADGTWDALTVEQKAELDTAADPSGKAPAGVLTEMPTAGVDEDGSPRNGVFIRGKWDANVRLAVNTGDYTPWTDLPFPESTLIRTDGDGIEFEVATEQNLTVLQIDTPDDYLTSLAQAGLATVSITTPQQPDEFFRDANSIVLAALGWEVDTPEPVSTPPK